MAVSSAAVSPAAGAFRNRWVQLTAGIVAMIAVANPQYGWTLFVKPIDDTHHWGATAI
jgi:MFS transporter, OFA family, oxalate/formate antiporter